VLGETIIQFPSPDAKTPGEAIARAGAFMEQFANDDLITPAIAPHSMYTLDMGSLRAVRAMADRHHAPVLIHLSETADEGRTSQAQHKATPTQYLESIGFWGPRTLAAHGVWLSPADMQVLRRRGVSVSHNPESNMKLASGTAKVVAMRQAGLAVGIGTDGAASNNDLDMFEAMRSAALVAKMQTGDPRALPAHTALAMATIEGARALGLEALIGSLESGKRADLIAVSTRSARQTPLYDPLSHLVYVTRGTDVTTTIVNGRVLMRDRKVLTLSEPDVLGDARALADKVRAAVGR
jgi:5-methylthioadenosine/S-adenosylhomocysteine deaminase